MLFSNFFDNNELQHIAICYLSLIRESFLGFPIIQIAMIILALSTMIWDF